MTLATFGVPFNATDQGTAEAREAVNDPKVWLFEETSFATIGHKLHRIPDVTIERPVHEPDYEPFRRGFEQNPGPQVLVLQGHPNSWFGDRSPVREFMKIARFLGNQGVAFPTPREVIADTASASESR